MARPIMASFDQGVAPEIACINKATVDLGVDFAKMVNSLQRYIDEFFAPVWGTPARLMIASNEIPSAWGLVFLDDADEANALGYHDLTQTGYPLSKIFVRTTIQNGDLVSVTASHEIAEMLIDPAINLWAQDYNDTLWAYETADACEEDTFQIDGVPVSDFLFPSYFEAFRLPGSRKFDFLGRINKPFEILKGGYSTIMRNGVISQIFGSEQKARRFAAEDRRGHRSTSRSAPSFGAGDIGTVIEPTGDLQGVEVIDTNRKRMADEVEVDLRNGNILPTDDQARDNRRR
jgi:hypothetical protein